MPFRLTWPLTLTILATPPALYSLYVYKQLRPTQAYPIYWSNDISQTLATSATVTRLVNPNKHVAATDTRSVLISRSSIPRHADGARLTDREVLDKFVKGVFGGRVFAPERIVLRILGALMGRPFVNYSALSDQQQQAQYDVLRTRQDVRAVRTWEVGMNVAGAFLVVDASTATDVHSSREGEMEAGAEADSTSETYIDLIWGADTWFIRGVNRFSVVSHNPPPDSSRDKEGEEKIELRYACLTCDPRQDRPIGPSWLMRFHNVYAMLLFRDAVAEVLAGEA